MAARPIGYLPDGTYLARMNLAGQRRAAPGHVVLRVIEYQVNGGEVIRLLTDLLDPGAYPAAELTDFMGTLASKVSRKPGSGPRRPRVADRLLKRQNPK